MEFGFFGALRARSAAIKPKTIEQNNHPRTHMRQNLARKCMNLINKSRILLAADLFASPDFRHRRSYPGYEVLYSTLAKVSG